MSSLTATAGGDILSVESTDESGPNSLRDAIIQANNHPGPDTIRFAIPNTDPNFDASAGIWAIRPQSELPVIKDTGLIINGYSQAAFIGADTNPDGPEIVLDGTNAGANAYGLNIASDNVEIYGLIINRFVCSFRILSHPCLTLPPLLQMPRGIPRYSARLSSSRR